MPAQPVNVALGKLYTYSPEPTYPLCTDPNDIVQLTDGVSSAGYFWTQKEVVGWQYVQYVTITIDLTKVESIQGLSFRSAAGYAGVKWPLAILISVSDDGQTYRHIGDLMTLDRAENGSYETTKYLVRKLATSGLKSHGRFVRLTVVPSGDYMFVDEIELIQGLSEWLTLTLTDPIVPSDPEKYWTSLSEPLAIKRRFEEDEFRVKMAIEKLPSGQVPALKDELEHLTDRLTANEFETRFPYNDAHARLFALQAKVWRAEGCDRFGAWRANPWDTLDLWAKPVVPQVSEQIVVHSMHGEWRSAAVNLVNAGDVPVAVTCRVEGLPGSPTPNYLHLFQVKWTDTKEGQPVAAALEEMPLVANPDWKSTAWPWDCPAWQGTVLPGIPGQLWLSFHVGDLAPGRYDGQLVIGMQQVMRIPLTLIVYPLDFPAQSSLLVGGWSYTDHPGWYGVTTQNRHALVKHLREHMVNAPWATNRVLLNFQFRSDGSIALNTEELDKWLDEWRGCSRYYVFLKVDDQLGFPTIGTSEFTEKVGKWISAVVAHLAERKNPIRADQLGLLLIDEPSEDCAVQNAVQMIVGWSQAIKAAEPNVMIWEDPMYADPLKAPAELWPACDVVCPQRLMWISAEESFRQFYTKLLASGKVLQFYSSYGPARLLDPYEYYRLQAWHCWKYGGTGSFFWAFGDNGGASSWNEYSVTGKAYTPVFLDSRSVVAGKQMEAVREGSEDYEYLVMLRTAIRAALKRRVPERKLVHAMKLLASAADTVLDSANCKEILWHTARDRNMADTVRVLILEQMVAVNAM